MSLTPILRRTFAIFRERPLLFWALPFAYAAISQTLIYLPKGHASRNGFLWVAIYAVVGTLSAAIVISLTLDAEQGIPPTFARAWLRVRSQAHLAKTAANLIAFMALVVCAIGFAAAIILATWRHGTRAPIVPLTNLHPVALRFALSIGLWVFDLLYAPVALTIPLLYIKRPSEAVDFRALDESRRSARGIFWSLAAILIASSIPSMLLSSLVKIIHLTPPIKTPGGWAIQLLMVIVTSCLASFTHIAFTLIALNRVASEASSEPLANPVLSPTLSPPVILL